MKKEGYWGEDDWAPEPDCDDYGDDPEFDVNAGYYGELEAPLDDEPAELASTYDHAYATYLGARQRFQQLKMARGFMPVVALTDNQTTVPIDAGPVPSGSKGKDKNKGKGKSKKGKGQNVVRYPYTTAKDADPRGRAKATNCLRCGQLGHWAANCPQNAKSSSPTSSNKRPAPGHTEGMAVKTEETLVLFQDEYGAECVDATMLDPGTSAFLSGYGPFVRYVKHLEELGYPVNQIRFARCERRFQFGGDASAQARWTVDRLTASWALSNATWCLAIRLC